MKNTVKNSSCLLIMMFFWMPAGVYPREGGDWYDNLQSYELMKSMKTLLFFSFTLSFTALYGCGQTGPLYLPAAEPTPSSTTTQLQPSQSE